MKAPYTLASLKVASQDPAENGKMYICPDSLAADKEGIIYDIVELNGKHNNVAFSLRNTGNDGEFLIESNGPSSAIGSFTGAWIKITTMFLYWLDLLMKTETIILATVLILHWIQNM